jgi:hypothetical protein
MKKLLLITAFLFTVTSATSQVLISILLGDKLNSDKLEFGLDGGLNLSTIQGQKGADLAERFNIGFYFDLKLKNPAWMIHTGVIVKSTMGAKDLPVYSLNDASLDAAFEGGKVDRRLNYFNVPILIKHLFKNKFSLEAGPMLGLMNKSVDVFTQKVKEEDDLTYEIKIRDNYHPLDAGFVVGAGYRLMGGNGMNLGVRYYMGLVDITIDDATTNQYNRSLYFCVGIPIGKGKKEVKKENP